MKYNIPPAVTFHDDVIRWKHFPRYWPFVRGIHRSPLNSPHKGQWHRALMFSLICAWINGWVKNREAGNLKRHCPHHDVIVMNFCNIYRHSVAVLKIKTICHARDLWKLAQSWKQLRLPCPPDPYNLSGTALLGGFQSSRGQYLVNVVLFWNKRPVNIWNNRKANLYVRCPLFLTLVHVGYTKLPDAVIDQGERRCYFVTTSLIGWAQA